MAVATHPRTIEYELRVPRSGTYIKKPTASCEAAPLWGHAILPPHIVPRRGTDTIITKKNSQQQCRACCWLCCLLKKIPFLLEVIEECGDTAERLLVGLLNLDAELNLHLGDASEVLDGVEVGYEAY